MSQPNNDFDDLSPAFAVALVDVMGGTTIVASKFDVSCAAVSRWKKRGLGPQRRDSVMLRYRSSYNQAKEVLLRAGLAENRLAA
jgi:hypothetical protein